MAELPYRPEHVNDESAHTEELTNEELGAYTRLQRALWRAGGYLPEEQIARFARAGKRWAKIAPAIVRKLTFGRGVFSCPRVLEVLMLTRDRRAKAAERAATAASARWGNSRSSGSFAHGQNGSLKPAKLLKSQEPSMLEALLMQSFDYANQNQNKNLSSSQTQRTREQESAEQGGIEAAIYLQGERLLTQRVGMRGLAARSQIAKWIASAADNPALATVLAAVERENVKGAHLVRIVDQRVLALENERERGPQLPLPVKPQIVRGSG